MKKFNRITAFFLSILLLMTFLPSISIAAEETNVSVTLSLRGAVACGEKEGKAVPIAGVPVSVTAENPTVNDVLAALHEAYYPGGAAAGYEAGPSSYGSGLSMVKLWGETDGVGGFYCNGTMPWTTIDETPVAEGDKLVFVVYRPDWSDSYACFEPTEVAAQTGESISLTLFADLYDDSYQVVKTPVANAQLVTVSSDGTTAAIDQAVTDENGMATLSFETAGDYVISATKEGSALTAPVCLVQVTGEPSPSEPPEPAVSLTGLSLFQNDTIVPFNETFAPEKTEYTATALTGTVTIVPQVSTPEETVITVNGQPLEDGAAICEITAGENLISIQAAKADGTGEATYTLCITGTAPAGYSYTIAPADSSFALFDSTGNVMEETEAQSFQTLIPGQTYTYTASKYGFLTERHTFVAGEETRGEITLEAAPENAHSGTSDWPSFRGNENNMGITHGQTPIVEKGLWAAKQKWMVQTSAFAQFGEFSWPYPSTAILVNDSVIAVSGNQLKKINLETGAIEQTVTMAGSREYAYIPPVYGDGMIFVSLNGGIVQAFDSETLQSVWISEPVGGQALSALTYADGYLYTGFYQGETEDGTFICLSVTDEEPEAAEETKYVSWKAATPGGYYWTGAYCRGEYVITTSENGAPEADKTAEGTLYVRNRYTGKLVDSEPIVGDGRSAIACDADSGQLYFTTKAGYLYRCALSAAGEIQSLQFCAYQGESTSTPVVYSGRVYFGLENQVVAADADTLQSVDTAELPGRVQGALLLSDCAWEETGTVFLYATYNAAPGGLMVLEDGEDGLCAQSLFTPEEAQQNYCISSPICGPDGVIYYVNDSGYLFAIERTEVEYCPVTFSLSPAEAALSLRDGEGNIVSPLTPGEYDLPAGVYQWSASAEGYVTKTGRIQVTEEAALLHTPQVETVTLSPKGGGEVTPAVITVSFALFGDTQHDSSIQHSYGKDKETLPQWIPLQSRTVSKGDTAYEVLISALDEAGLSYETGRAGYVSSINGLSEQDNGPQSGWMYQVNGKIPQMSSSSYVLKEGDELIWFYTDDYRLEDTVLPSPEPTQDPSPTTPVPPDDPTVPFPFVDVPEDHWARPYIEELAQNGLVKGKDEHHFAPADTLTRGEFVTLLYRVSGAKAEETAVPFSDVPADAWYADAVSWAVQAGVTKGTSKDTFAPNLTIARQDMMLMIVRFLDHMTISLPEKLPAVSYVDEAEMREDAKEAIFRLSRAEICNGVGNGRFAPKETATRAEAAKLLCLLRDLMK